MNVIEINSRYWRPLEASHKSSAWEALDAAYSDSGRVYHSWSHISDLLEALDQFSALATRRDLIATAIFWHDAVYVTRGADSNQRADASNVHDSARMFRRHSLMNAADAEAVQELIMATANHLEARPSRERYAGFSRDLDLFLDLDLSPLAASWNQFASNFEAIRFEFSWVPEQVFNAGQARFLEGILANGDKLFRRPETIRQWRRKALANITHCLKGIRSDGQITCVC